MTDPPDSVRGSRLLLDADVLYPIRICDFILTAATLGLTQRPVVSDVILDEAQRNISTDRPALIEAMQRRFAAVRRSTDGHGLAIPKRFVDDEIINAKDRHVVAAARFHDVDVIVSNDKRLRREVDAWVARHGARLRAWSADELATRLLDEDRSAVVETVEAMAARMTKPHRSTNEVLTVLIESMPSLRTLTTPAIAPNIRAAALDDAALIVRLIHEAFREYEGSLDPPSAALNETAESISRELVSDAIAFIAGLDTEAVGCVLARPKDDHLYFGRLSVRLQHRSRGVATALVTAVEAEARRRGLAGVELAVRIALPANQQFFARLGYAEVARETHAGYSTPTSITMRKATTNR